MLTEIPCRNNNSRYTETRNLNHLTQFMVEEGGLVYQVTTTKENGLVASLMYGKSRGDVYPLTPRQERSMFEYIYTAPWCRQRCLQEDADTSIT